MHEEKCHKKIQKFHKKIAKKTKSNNFWNRFFAVKTALVMNLLIKNIWMAWNILE